MQEVAVDFAAKRVLIRVDRDSRMADSSALQHEIRSLGLAYDPVLILQQ